MIFDLAKISITNPEKKLCGDYTKFYHIENEKLLLLTLADGVGSNACDWKASRIVCESFIEKIQKNVSIHSLRERIKQAINYANELIFNEQGTCKGMKTTFLGLVWEYTQNTIHYVSIGDSRIYTISKEEVKQITKDETKAVIRKNSEGKPLIYAGAVVESERVTNVLGALGTYEIYEMNDENIDVIFLSSDGFYRHSGTEKTMLHIIDFLDLESSLENNIKSYIDRQNDDMSVLVARKGVNQATINDVFSKIEKDVLKSEINIPEYKITLTAFSKIKQFIEEKNIESSLKLLDYYEKNKLQFGKEKLIDLLNFTTEQKLANTPVFQKLLKITRSTN